MDYRAEILKRCRSSIITLGRVIQPEAFNLPSPECHFELEEWFMDKSIPKGSIEAPRETAKSSLGKYAVMHHYLFDEGDKVILLQSKTRKEAIKKLWGIKNIIEYNEKYRDLFGYHGEQVADTWREDYVKFRINGEWVTISAIGTGQQARGILEDYTRITFYLLDDPDDEDSCATKEAMDKNFDKFLGNMAGVAKDGRSRVIGTPIREGCIVERLRGAIGWVTKHYSSLVDATTKEMLWEEKRSYDELMSLKKEHESFGKLSKYFSEYECEIVGDEDRTFRDWGHWDGEITFENNVAYLILKKKNKIELIEPEKIPVNIFAGIDPASSTKQSADYSVTFLIAYSADERIYTLPYYRKRTNPMSHAEQIIETIKNFKPTRAHVETVGYQEFLRQYLRQRLLEENLYVPGLETKFNPRTEKSARLETLQPFFATGRVYIKEGQEELEEELRMYPRGRHDDLLDGLYYATRKLIVPDHTTKTDSEEDDLRYFLRTGISKQTWMSN